MRIGTIGAGNMARALGAGWRRAGHEVFFGARSPERAAALAAEQDARGGGVAEAAEFGEVVLLAVPGDAVTWALAPVAGTLRGRTLIDCTNDLPPAAFAAPPDSFTPATDAVAERVAAAAPGAAVVKAFSMLAAEVWASGARSYEGSPLTVPLCGDDPDALAVVSGLVSDLGLRPVPGGGLDRARQVEAMTAFVMGLWFAGQDARATLPPLPAAFAVPDA